MKLTTALRLGIAVEVLVPFLTMIWIIIFYTDSSLHPLLQEYQAWESTQKDLFFIGDNGHWSVLALISIMIIMYLIACIGLFIGNAWAKPIYISLFVIYNILFLFATYPMVDSNVGYMLDSYSIAAGGFVLALLLFTDVPLDKPTNWFVIIPAFFVFVTYPMYIFFF